MRKSIFVVFSLLVAVSMLVSACAPAATPAAAPAAPAAPTTAPAAPAAAPTTAPAAPAATTAPAAAATTAPAAPAATAAPATATPAPTATYIPTTTAIPGKKILKVWSFTNEIRTMAIAFEGLHPDVQVQYTMIPMTNGEYQTKIKASLNSSDAPDVIALEASFVKSFVESDEFLADLSKLKPLATADKTYPAVLDVGTNNGVLKALSYQATPGALFYRRSLAKLYFGTDDPVKIQALLSDMTKYTAAAEVIKTKSKGNTYMVASSGDFQNPILNQRKQPFVVDNTFVMDPMVKTFVDTAKTFRDKGYEAQATQWGDGWYAGMNDTLADASGQPKQIFSYFLPTWGLPYVLAPNAVSKDKKHTTVGDWAVITGPLNYQWGGTWIGAIKGSQNMDLATQFVTFCTLDQKQLANWANGTYTNDFLKKIDPNIPEGQSQAAGDFVSSQVVVQSLIPGFDKSDMSKFLGGQNSYGGFAAAAPSVSARLMQGSDDQITRDLNDPVAQYLNGKITSEDDVWTAWKNVLKNDFPDMIIK